jgi:hypothetical protein
MDITNADIELPKVSLPEATLGSYLEFIDEFEIAPGTRLKPD